MSEERQVGITQIVGVVTPLGSFGVQMRDVGWMFGLHLNPWRVLGEQAQFKELRVTMPMSREQIDIVRATVAPTDVLCLSIRELAPTERGTYTARFEAWRRSSGDDTEMEAAASELRLPMQVDTQHFGSLQLDRRIDLFEGSFDFAGHRVGVSIPAIPDSTKLEERALSIANAAWADLQSLDSRAREFASAQLLALKNDNWLDEGEEAISGREFQARMSLSALHVGADGQVSLYYEDGDLFFGHSIDVHGTHEGDFTEAKISG